jgi:small subunit ribosomal protein S16
MALKIRMRKQGRRNQACFRIVVTETTTRRDGKYNEVLGWYNPHGKTEEHTLSVKADRVQHWLNQGAEISEKVACLMLKAAPVVMKEQREKAFAKRAKLCQKRREARKA